MSKINYYKRDENIVKQLEELKSKLEEEGETTSKEITGKIDDLKTSLRKSMSSDKTPRSWCLRNKLFLPEGFFKTLREHENEQKKWKEELTDHVLAAVRENDDENSIADDASDRVLSVLKNEKGQAISRRSINK